MARPGNLPKKFHNKWANPWKVWARTSPSFRKWLDANGYITPHFTWREWASKDGRPVPAALRKNAIRHAWKLERLRHRLGDRPLSAISYYRSPQHNANVGGARQSRHMQADASDFSKATVDSFGRAKFLAAGNRIFKGDGIGQYPGGSVHLDSRGWVARWNSWRR